MTLKFQLGRCVATPGALALLEENNLAYWVLLDRHQSGDWGELPTEDAQMNEDTINLGLENRLLSSYPMPDGKKVWVITEADRSSTTLLLPKDY